MTADVIRIGTRGSALALAQARLVADRLNARGVQSALEIITSDGDRDKTTPLTELGGRGVFASSLQQALLAGRIDLAVHSAKDLPTLRPQGLVIAAFLERDDPRDVLVSRHSVPLVDLPPGPVIATSSRRRMVQILAVRPDARCIDLRGNIDSRLRKAFDSDLDGIVLAAAGILRLGWGEKITEYLDPEVFVPAPGQAALAIEVRRGDRPSEAIAADLDEPTIRAAVAVERAFLSEIGAGCTVPVGAYASLTHEGQITLRGMVSADRGGQPVWRSLVTGPQDAAAEARALAREMQRECGVSSTAFEGTNPWRHLLAKTVLITRPASDEDPLAAAIRLAGGVPIVSPAVEIAGRHLDQRDLETITALGLGTFDWVAFTSRCAIHQFADQQVRIPAGTRIAVVGEATRAAATQAGISVDLVSQHATGRGLAQALLDLDPRPANVLFVRGSRARPDFSDSLRFAGVEVTELTVYETHPATEADRQLIARLLRNEIDAITLLAPSAVEGLRAQAGDQWERACGIPAVVIGSTTAAAARAAGVVNLLESDTPSVDGIVAALQSLFQTYMGQAASEPARNEGV